jgi:MinD-like ATPase involved in chromosome partitioning or flagellar assembly
MTQIISIHSFRRGTGKSIMTANIAALLAAEGRRVMVIDTNLESPSLHILFGLKENQFSHTLNEFLWGQCQIQQAVHHITRIYARSRADLVIPASSDFGV